MYMQCDLYFLKKNSDLKDWKIGPHSTKLRMNLQVNQNQNCSTP